MASGLLETAVRLRGTAGTAVSAEYGLALAAVAGAPVRVADAVMDRLAVPVPGEDMPAPFLSPGRPGQPRRFEPRNMAFTDGLDYWELAGSFSGDGQRAGPDYSCTAADRSAVLAATVPEPAGPAVLVQAIAAEDYRDTGVTFRGQLRATGITELDYSATAEDGRAILAAAGPEPAGFAFLAQEIDAGDYRGRTVTFRGELRTAQADGRAGLALRAPSPSQPGQPDQIPGKTRPHIAYPAGTGTWTQYEVTAQVPADANLISFGVVLNGGGQVELRHPLLAPHPPGQQ